MLCGRYSKCITLPKSKKTVNNTLTYEQRWGDFFRFRLVFQASGGRWLICLHLSLVYPCLVACSLHNPFHLGRIIFRFRNEIFSNHPPMVFLNKSQIFWNEFGCDSSHARNINYNWLIRPICNAKFNSYLSYANMIIFKHHLFLVICHSSKPERDKSSTIVQQLDIFIQFVCSFFQ